MTLLSGAVIGGHYEIRHLLGAGAFGKTYQAEDLRAGRSKRAIKHLSFTSNDPATFAKSRELFEREAAVLLNLTESPKKGLAPEFIPRFFAYFDENQQFYLVQELIQGRTLRDKLRQEIRLSETEVVEFLEEMLTILSFLHGERIIHRDIKPENVMIRDRDSRIVLIDFGAVKQEVTHLAQSGTIIQSPGYTPPEQVREAEYNSDLYALGMTALEALTGLEPERLKDRHTGRVLWPPQSQFSERLVRILEKMVHEDHIKGRYQSADDVLRDIKEFRKTLVVSPSARSLVRTPSTTSSNISLTPGSRPDIPVWLMFGILVPVVIAIALPLAFLTTKALEPIVSESNPSESPTTSEPNSSNLPTVSQPTPSESPIPEPTISQSSPPESFSPELPTSSVQTPKPVLKPPSVGEAANAGESSTSPHSRAANPSPVEQNSPPNPKDSDTVSPIRFKRPNSQITGDEAQPITSTSQPSSDSPIRFKRTNSMPNPASLQPEEER
jgi:serine/threonine protein kinase